MWIIDFAQTDLLSVYFWGHFVNLLFFVYELYTYIFVWVECLLNKPMVKHLLVLDFGIEEGDKHVLSLRLILKLHFNL